MSKYLKKQSSQSGNCVDVSLILKACNLFSSGLVAKDYFYFIEPILF